jgi:hypothetical protein
MTKKTKQKIKKMNFLGKHRGNERTYQGESVEKYYNDNIQGIAGRGL